MKTRYLLFTIFAAITLSSQAGITTYTFTGTNWTSKVGVATCDGTTDGWVSNNDASEYMKGMTDAQGRLYSQGVSVKTGTTGAGATSIKSFTNIRQLTLNFCLNASKGKGVFYYQVGTNTPDSLIINKPATSGSGVYLRDSVIRLAIPQTGQITFWVKCTENAININSLTIRAEEGGTNPFTQDSYQLVTSVAQLQDSDQIIIGVHKDGVNKIMGYFDENVSQNNIHAINGKYSADRTTVDANDEAIYTLRKATNKGKSCFYIQDELRYKLAYLVANGGQTKNRLALWTSLVDEKTFGDYGYWDITIAADGAATIMNLGNSKGKYLQYNSTNTPTLFSCYPEENQTAVAIYRLTPAIGIDDPAIAAPMVNFGTAILEDAAVTGSKTIVVNANKLTQDIQVSLKHGEVFSLGTSVLDRDGDNLNITYNATAPGKYIDTLVLQSGEVIEQTAVMLTVANLMNIADVIKQPDYTMVYLNEVEVTKKYDNYVFIRDETGSMLIWDNGNLYGKDLKSGSKLTGVCGRYQNYFKVPELAPTAQWSVKTGDAAVPENATLPLDMMDVCRFVRLTDVTITDGQLAGEYPLPVIDAFNTGVSEGHYDMLDAIVMISWDKMQLWVVRQQNDSNPDPTSNSTPYIDTKTNLQSKYVEGANVLIRHNGHIYHISGQTIK